MLTCSQQVHRCRSNDWLLLATLVPNVSLLTISRTFNSLFKVLFIFPSRYLFAIGFPPIFSVRWNLPPIWAAIPSNSTPRTYSISSIHKYERGYHPPWRAFPDHLIRAHPMDACSSDHIPEGFQPVLFPLHSPLLGKSLLVSFPPLSYMLKFSGYSYLIGGPNKCEVITTILVSMSTYTLPLFSLLMQHTLRWVRIQRRGSFRRRPSSWIAWHLSSCSSPKGSARPTDR